MLGKLLKYEIPAVGRKLIPLYIAWIAASCLLGFAFSGIGSKSQFLTVIAILVYAMVVAAVFAMAVILIVQRYRSSLLGDEAYFNMVLPVKTWEQIGNKTVSALVWVVASGIVAILSAIMITLFAGGNLDWSWWMDVFKELEGMEALLLIEFTILFLLSTVKSVLAIYAALTLGHQFPKHVWLASIVTYIILMVIEGMIGNIVMSISFFAEPEGVIMDQIFICTALAMTLALIAGYFFLCKYMMEKRLNLE